MKKYMEYMDSVRASDTLHQRLLGLEAAGKRPTPWKRYGAVAAALALVVGLGGYGMHYYNTMVNPRGDKFLEATLAFDPEVHPDIAVVEPGDVTEPAEKTLGGYEVVSGSGENAMTSYYILPYIDYGAVNEASDQKIAMDWAIQEGAVERELTQGEIVALMGGEGAVADHLDWGGYELSGRIWERPDGSMLLVLLGGYRGPLDHFEFSVMDGSLPPTCIAYEGSVTQEIRGLTVTADKHDGKDGCGRRVSFMKDGYGYRFDLTSTDVNQAERLVSRLVCRIADQGVTCPDWDGGYTCSNCGQFVPADEKHSHTFIGEGEIPEFVPDYDPTYEDGLPGYDSNCPYCADGTVHTHPYDPAGPVSVSDAPAASEEICGYPLAPDTHTCEVCGQALPAGVEHSHQEEHHQEHHSGHH